MVVLELLSVFSLTAEVLSAPDLQGSSGMGLVRVSMYKDHLTQ